jgi:ParB family transcriptional regulator, chromosome partitioning protein
MDLQVPLNRLKFGQEDGGGINARVVGRQDGIAELAANIHARGQIENLVVKACGEGFYAVSNGNRRLAAFHMIHGKDSDHPIACTLREVDEAGAFEDSLTTAVTAKQLHPVDQFEAFARMRYRHGKTDEEIASHYGMTKREVEQALALGHLSPKVREAWRSGELKSSAARAFTLADHKRQDEVLERLRNDGGSWGREVNDFDDNDVKEILDINQEVGLLVEFVGIDAYVARGGKVTRDLFGIDHIVSDEKLARKMADEKLADECGRLVKSGWGFAVTKHSVRNTHWNYSSLKAESKPTEEEQQLLNELERVIIAPEGGQLDYHQMSAVQQKAFLDRRVLVEAIELRAYLPKAMAKAGCFVDINHSGFLKVEYGKVKPAQKEAAAKVERDERKERKKEDAKAAKTAGTPPPEPTELSNALKERLEAQLVGATCDALAACLQTDELKSPIAQVLGRLVSSQIKVNGSSVQIYSHGTSEQLPAMREAMPAAIVNDAIARRFDRADYFSSAPKGFIIKAIAETINPDEARKAAQGSKREIAEFALKNLQGTGWVPKELRTKHYVPPVVKAKVAAARAAKPSTTRESVQKAKAARTAKQTQVAAKRLARSAAKKKKR